MHHRKNKTDTERKNENYEKKKAHTDSAVEKKGRMVKKEENPFIQKEKEEPSFLWLVPFENCSTWLFRNSEVTYVLNIVSNNKSTHTVKRWT